MTCYFTAPYGCNIDSDEMSCFEKIRNVTVLIDQAEEYDQSGEIYPVENMIGSSVFVWLHSYDCSAGSSKFGLKKAFQSNANRPLTLGASISFNVSRVEQGPVQRGREGAGPCMVTSPPPRTE